MISIVIPCYVTSWREKEFMAELMDSARAQSFSDYEIVVSEASVAEELTMGNIRWVKGREGAAANLNNAIDHARGNIIKPMFQDDKFMEPDSLQKIADAMEHASWIACTSHNEGIENYDHVPRVHKSLEALRQGENTYGSPSAVAWRRNELRMDENLKWLFDCEFYARLIDRYGLPKFVDTPIFIRQWEGQATRTLCDGNTRILDHNEVVEKYRDRGGLARV